jgi:curved DNA-binding protein CbpA
MSDSDEEQFPDYYKILQVHPEAEPEVIEAAWRKLAFIYHPDRYDGADREERMKSINAAHDVLKNPTERAKYDALYREQAGGNLSKEEIEEYIEELTRKRREELREELEREARKKREELEEQYRRQQESLKEQAQGFVDEALKEALRKEAMRQEQERLGRGQQGFWEPAQSPPLGGQEREPGKTGWEQPSQPLPPSKPKNLPLNKKVLLWLNLVGTALVVFGLILGFVILGGDNPSSTIAIPPVGLGILLFALAWIGTLIDSASEGRWGIFIATLWLWMIGTFIYCLTGNPSNPPPRPSVQPKPKIKKRRSRLSRSLRLVGALIVLSSLLVWFTAGYIYLSYLGTGGLVILTLEVINSPFMIFSALRAFDGRNSISSGLAIGTTALGAGLTMLILLGSLQPGADAASLALGIELSGFRTASLIGITGAGIGIIGALLP